MPLQNKHHLRTGSTCAGALCPKFIDRNARGTGFVTRKVVTSLASPSIIVCAVVVQRLHESRQKAVIRKFFLEGAHVNVRPGDERTGNEKDEDNKEKEVHNRITDNAAFTKLRLLQRINRRTDLTTR